MTTPARFFTVLLLFFIGQSFAQCPDDFYVGMIDDGCNEWEFEIGEFTEGVQVLWDFGDGLGIISGHYTQHTYSANGIYEVCGHYVSPLCPDTAIYCQSIEVACEDAPCELDVLAEIDGDILVLNPVNYPNNAQIWWSVNNNDYGPSESFSFDLSSPGVFQICAFYETPECPFGVEWCETWTVEAENDCPGEDDFYADNVEGSCTSWVFEIGSFVEGEEVFWEYGDGTWEWGGHFTDHLYQQEGEYEVCAYYHSPLCPDTVILCQNIIVECDDNPCELDVEVLQDGDILYFTPSNYPDNATIYWSVNGDNYVPGEEYTFELNEPGTFQICAGYETPECPQGVYWCETWTVEGDDCPTLDDFYVGPANGSCLGWIFEIGSFVEGEEVFWEYGDGTWEWGGHFTDHLYQQEGEYEVCGYYHSPLCPDTVILCQNIVVECSEISCELDMEVEQDGDTLLFYPFNYPDGVVISWYINDDFQGNGDMFSISIADPGSYTVCAGYETPECPEGVFWCETWTVEGNDCPTLNEFYAGPANGSCLGWIFEIGSFVEGEQVIWDYGDGTSEIGGHFTDHMYQEEGEYEVCGYYSSPLCPDTVVLCQTILVDCENNDCQLNMEVEQDGDTLLFYPFNYPDGAVISWYINDDFQGNGDLFSISIADPGSYTVCAGYETPECPEGVFWCETWIVEGNDCPTLEDFYVGQADGSCLGWIFEIGSFVEGEQVIWDYGDGTTETGGHFTDHMYQEEGLYQVCAYYSSPLCPDTVFLCQTILIDCNDEDCELDMEVEQDGDTLLFNPFNYPDDALISWYINDDFQGTGDLFSISIADPGSYTVCAVYDSPECPLGVEWCETWVIEECVNVSMAFTFNGDLDFDFVEWELDGIESDWVEDGELIIPLDSLSIIVSACIPTGCYEFTVSTDAPLDLQDINIVFEASGVDIELIWLPSEDDDEIIGILSVNADCDTSVGIEESILANTLIYPVPSTGMLYIDLQRSAMANARVYNPSGQMILQESFNQFTEVSLSHLPAGLYVVQLQLGNELKTFSIPLLNR